MLGRPPSRSQFEVTSGTKLARAALGRVFHTAGAKGVRGRAEWDRGRLVCADAVPERIELHDNVPITVANPHCPGPLTVQLGARRS
jgi:hypothetical protein